MTSNELRKKYLKFFEAKGHKIIPSASLVPENDPTVLFTTAGMHPLVPYLMGEKHPAGNRLTDVQKCIRTGDIDEVGDNTHLTFFEMLGNWSLGDYFKNEAIEWSFEFLTKELNLDKNRLAVSVFAGDSDAPFDNEAFEKWKSLGISEKRIAKLPKKNNWWGPAGETGPCGPDTEIFYWTGNSEEMPESFNDDNSNWVEIWNNVFMEYNKTKDGKFEPLAQKNVDTGMGLERTVMVLNDQKSVFETDVFVPLMTEVSRFNLDSKAQKIIVDHIKASVFILSEGITPGNTGRDYVLRRLIRRAVRFGKDLDLTSLAQKVIEIYKDVYLELLKNKEKIISELKLEKERFEKTLEKGLKEFEKGTDPFILFTTYGFPIELVKEIAKEQGKIIDEEKFNDEMKKHQELSRTSSAGMFKGGLADAGEETKKLHTATHLLRRALEIVLGEEIMQKGSNITPERLRFDFGFSRKLTPEEIQKVENLVNKKIAEDLPVSFEEMTVDEAKQKGAVGVFDSKYGEKVKVYTIANFSQEICGGPHVSNTSELGKFKIQKEEAVSAGVRRIKAIILE